jgi:hypothetical protein
VGASVMAEADMMSPSLDRPLHYIRPPVGMLAEVAEVVQAGLIGEVRNALEKRFPLDLDGSPARIANYIEDGLLLLTSHHFNLQDEPEFSMDRIEACRTLADREPRFRFIYRLPSSAGWGAAIGETIETSLFGETHDPVRTVTALLNAFMTFLDGLLDEAPEIIAPHREALLQLVRCGASGNDVSRIRLPGDHPYTDMCFLIARLWIRRSQALYDTGASPAPGPRQDFKWAAVQSMLDEYSVCDARFHSGLPPSAEPLYGRTRWPLWTQALAAGCQHIWPKELDYAAFRRLIFCIGDYAAWLDDLRDYVGDCMAGQWNTASYALYSHRPFTLSPPEGIQAQLLINLSEKSFAGLMIQTAVNIRQSIDELLDLPGLAPEGMHALIADLTYEYLG